MTVYRLADPNGAIGWKCDICRSIVYMTADDKRDPAQARWNHTCAQWEPIPDHPKDGSPHIWISIASLDKQMHEFMCRDCKARMQEPW